MEADQLAGAGGELLDPEEDLTSFRGIRKGAVAFGNYQKRLFIMMGFYWVTASFFLILPFYFFKHPEYCRNPQLPPFTTCLGTPFPSQNAIWSVRCSCVPSAETVSDSTYSTSTPSPMSSVSSARLSPGTSSTKYV